MLRKAKKILLPTLSALIVCASGCSGFTADGNSLLRPPRPTGDKAAIQEIISREAGGSYNLKYPQKGVNRSAITLRNEDTDNEYALALYSTENDAKLNVSIIAFDGNQWKCLGTYTNNSSGVDRVLFCDLNADKREEIIIGWTSYNSAQKSLTAYSFDSEEVYEMSIDETYDDLAIVDMTSDSTDDIVLLSLSTQETPSVATLLQYSDQDKRPVGKYSMELDPEVIAFSNIVVGDVAINTTVPPPEVKGTASGARADNSSVSSGESGDEESSYAEDSADESSDIEASDESSVAKPESSDESESSGNEEESSDDENSEESTVSVQESSEQSSEDESSQETEVSQDTESKPESEASVPEESSSTSESSTDKNPPKPIDANTPMNRKGVVIDCKRSDNTICTQMVYYDNRRDELIDPIARRKDGSTYVNSTLRTEAVFSRDIDGDDVIEVPVSTPMSAAADEAPASVCNLTAWCNFDAGEQRPHVSMNTVMNLKDGYYFVMPERWVGTVTARSDAETREMTFFLWNTKTSSTGDKLLTISRLNEQQWKESSQEGKIRLDLNSEKSKAVFAAQLFVTSADEALNLTESELQGSVYLI